MIGQGQWLFRWRSYLPFMTVPVLVFALRDAWAVHQSMGALTDQLWEGLCVALALLGSVIRGATIGYVPRETSGRNTKRQKAAQLNMTGMYSIVQHPLYLGNFVMFLAMALWPGVWWFAALCALAFWLYYERIMLAEEHFLSSRFGEQHGRWAAATPVFVPTPRQWRPWGRPFSARQVLKREYSGWFLIVAYFALAEVLERTVVPNRVASLRVPLALFAAGTFAFVVLRTLKKNSSRATCRDGDGPIPSSPDESPTQQT